MKNIFDDELYVKDQDSYKIYYNSIRKYPVLSDDEVKYLFALYRQNRSKKIKNDLINCHLRLACKYAWKYLYLFKRLDVNDLVQEANIILLKAIDIYADSKMEYDFQIYLRSQLKYGMFNLLNDKDDLFRLPASVKNDYRKIKKSYEFIKKYSKYEKITKEKLLKVSGLSEERYKRVLRLNQKALYLDTEIDVDDKKVTYKDIISDSSALELHEAMIEKEIRELCNEALKFLTFQEKSILLQTMQKDFVETDLNKIAINNFLSKNDVVKIKDRAIRKLRQNQKISSYNKEMA